MFGDRRKGLRLGREDDGTWTAIVVPAASARVVSGATALEAALRAWEEFGLPE